jgi:anti-anti-sigma factor
MNHVFAAKVRQLPGLSIIDLSGEINAFADQELDAAYSEADQTGGKSILLNFSNVTYINSTGIALIVGLLARARKSQKRLAVCGLSDHYREIFQITRLVDFMTIYPDETSLLAEVNA